VGVAARRDHHGANLHRADVAQAEAISHKP
jgi:hypothetical protein